MTLRDHPPGLLVRWDIAAEPWRAQRSPDLSPTRELPKATMSTSTAVAFVESVFTEPDRLSSLEPRLDVPAGTPPHHQQPYGVRAHVDQR